jgi:ankyrin repeat protein
LLWSTGEEQLLVYQGADPNVVDVDGKTALHRAIYNGDEGSVEVLLSSKTPLNFTLEDSGRWTPLRWAAAYGQLKVVEMLLRAGAEVDAENKDKWTAVRWAAQNGRKAVVELLINHNASLETPNPNEWTLLRWAAKEGLEQIIKLLVEKRVDLDVADANSRTALWWAVTYGHATTAWLLIEGRANINKPDDKGKTPLHAAVEICPSARLSSTLCILLEKGAKISAKTKSNEFSMTPLHLAASRGSHSAVWLLVENGADPTLGDVSDRTALHYAITAGHFKVAQLLAWRAEKLMHVVDYETRTPLHYAASLGHLEIVEMLLNSGAHINVCDIEGSTPLYLAVDQQQEKVVTCLVGRGADMNIPNKKKKKRMIRSAIELGNTVIIESLRRADEGKVAVERNQSPMPREEAKEVKTPGRYAARVEDE